MAISAARALGAIALLALATTACSTIPGQQGYLVDTVLIDSIQPGIDNRESVEKTLGRPSFVAEFDDSAWYYVSRETRNLGFNRPKPKSQVLLIVSFDKAGAVTAVNRRGLEQVASIDMEGDKTPTLGRKRSFLNDIFGNIGRVGGVGGGAPSNDNP